MEKLLLLTALVVFDMSGLAQESSEAGQIGWLAQVARTQATQPHWITPVVTVTPRLEQEFRYDISKRTETNGTAMEVYGNGKGPEFIPIQPFQVTLGLPGYVVHHQASVSDGWGDFSLLVKYRLLARDENHGNYILTAFLGASVPTGSHNIGAGHGTFSPTLAAGKGFGEFSVQSTVAITLSTSSGEAVGRPISHNTALQYQVRSIFWPEVEVNSTFWRSGVQAGQKQVFARLGNRPDSTKGTPETCIRNGLSDSSNALSYLRPPTRVHGSIPFQLVTEQKPTTIVNHRDKFAAPGKTSGHP